MGQKYFHPQTDFFRKFNLPPPETVSHGDADDIASKMTPTKANSWRLEGNQLIMETDMGPVVNRIPTNYIMKGIGEDGLPILVKLT